MNLKNRTSLVRPTSATTRTAVATSTTRRSSLRRILGVLPIAAALAIALGGAMTHAAERPIRQPRVPTLPPTEEISNADLVEAARRSPLFKRTLQAGELRRSDLRTVRVLPGVQMDFQRYVAETRLPSQPQLAPLFDHRKAGGVLSGPPVYQEEILELADRLVVDRRLTVPVADGACADPEQSEIVAQLCFTKGDKDPDAEASKPVAEDLGQMRAALASQPGDTVVRGDITAADALAMSDEELLDLVLNSDQRTIHHISIVPLRPLARGASRGGALKQFESRLAQRNVLTGLTLASADFPPLTPASTLGPDAEAFTTRYFLTGFTYGKEIDDSWEYTFVEGSWWHDRYYIRVDYHIGVGFGLRAPFSVNVRADGVGAAAGPIGRIGGGSSASTRNVEVSVAPVNVDANGLPAYPAVGLPANKTFGGNEFVLELKASCDLYVSIPGPNISESCPSVDLDYSRSINPVIGSGVSTINDWWLDGSVTGLGIDLGVASASLDIGIGADVRNGRIGMRSTALGGASISAGGTGNLQFASTNPIAFSVTRSGGAFGGGGFRLDDPTYRFDVRATPKLRAKIGVDVAIYENEWIIGPYALDFLAIEAGFQLSRHPGTVSRHDYALFTTIAPPIANP